MCCEIGRWVQSEAKRSMWSLTVTKCLHLRDLIIPQSRRLVRNGRKSEGRSYEGGSLQRNTLPGAFKENDIQGLGVVKTMTVLSSACHDLWPRGKTHRQGGDGNSCSIYFQRSRADK